MVPGSDRPSHWWGRYPRTLQQLARDYMRIRIYRHQDVLQMRTYCRDVRRELGRLCRFRSQYRRQRGEILRLRMLVHQLKSHRRNLGIIRYQKSQLEAQRVRIIQMQNRMRDMRRSRCLLHRDWRFARQQHSQMKSQILDLTTEVELLRSQLTLALQGQLEN